MKREDLGSIHQLFYGAKVLGVPGETQTFSISVAIFNVLQQCISTCVHISL